MRIGVWPLQGAFKEHQRLMSKCGTKTVPVSKPEEIEDIDGLIIPGGERAAVLRPMQAQKIREVIIEKAHQGFPLFGTCAGMIMLAKDILDGDFISLGLMDIKVQKKGFGGKGDSFKADLSIDALGKAPFPGVFIRAPYIESVKPNVGILAVHDGKTVMVRQGNFLGATFCPELTDDLRVHLYFKQMIKDAKG